MSECKQSKVKMVDWLTKKQHQHEVYIFVFLRSEASGNCLYSSVSLALVGDNSLLDELRIMTSVELFLNSSFYIKHPVLIAAFEKHGVDITRSFNNLLPFISSFESTSRFDVPEDIIKNEAILNCHDKQWCSFLCMLGLSSAISVNISSYYPDCGLEKYKLYIV